MLVGLLGDVITWVTVWLHKQHMIRSTSASSLRRFARTRALFSTRRVVECGRLQPGQSWSGELISACIIRSYSRRTVHTAVVACLLAVHFVQRVRQRHGSSHFDCFVVKARVLLFRPNTNKFTHILFAFGKIFGHVFLIWQSKFYLLDRASKF